MLFAAVLAAALSGGPSVVALARCNNLNAVHLEDQVRGFEKNPPSPANVDARMADLQAVISSADNEAIILRGVCSDKDFEPLIAQLDAVDAWALVLESDLSRQNNAKACPAAELPVARAYVADAWFHLARGDLGGTGKYPTVQTVLPKVQTRAAALNLTLPTRDDTTQYWLNTIQEPANEATKGCPQ